MSTESAQILCMTNVDTYPYKVALFVQPMRRKVISFLFFFLFSRKKRRFIGIGGAQHGAERKAHERRVGTNSLHDKCGHLCL